MFSVGVIFLHLKNFLTHFSFLADVLRLPVASLFPLDNADLRTVIACYDKDLFGWWCFFFVKGDLNKGCVDAKNFSGAECVGLRPSVGHDEEEGRLCALLFRDDFGPNNPK